MVQMLLFANLYQYHFSVLPLNPFKPEFTWICIIQLLQHCFNVSATRQVADKPFHVKGDDLMLFKKSSRKIFHPSDQLWSHFCFFSDVSWHHSSSIVASRAPAHVPYLPHPEPREPERDGNRPQGVVMGNGGGSDIVKDRWVSVNR